MPDFGGELPGLVAPLSMADVLRRAAERQRQLEAPAPAPEPHQVERLPLPVVRTPGWHRQDTTPGSYVLRGGGRLLVRVRAEAGVFHVTNVGSGGTRPYTSAALADEAAARIARIATL